MLIWLITGLWLIFDVAVGARNFKFSSIFGFVSCLWDSLRIPPKKKSGFLSSFRYNVIILEPSWCGYGERGIL